MSKISLLDDLTINQIAAGEVIENPASVVKELIENAKDAGATQVLIETLQGGRGLIRVSDNGEGIDKEDLPLSIIRHATSKIRQAEDLVSLITMGFRGEALASIAAVSKLLIHSAKGQGGACLKVEGGGSLSIIDRPRQPGTTVEVKQLFYNVPARLAFLGSPSGDTADINRVITRFALTAKEVAITWIHDGKTLLDIPSNQSFADRIASVLGQEYFKQLIQAEDLGYIGKAAFHKPNRTGQFLIVNGRFVQNELIEKWVLEAYGTRLPAKRYPAFVLNLTLPPSWVDINVHPQKKEMRLRFEMEIKQKISQSIEKVFCQHTPQPIDRPIQADFKSFMAAFSAEDDREPPPLFHILQREEKKEQLSLPISAGPCHVGVFKHWLLHEIGGVLLAFNLYEALFQIRLEKTKYPLEKQMLLVPQTIEVLADEVEVLEEGLERMNRLGMEMRRFGEKTFIIEAIPVWMEPSEIKDFIDSVIEKGIMQAPVLIASRGRKKHYSLTEALTIWSDFHNLSQPDHQRLGRPISINLKLED
jgi:DNA mismatch repair protein MutL